MSRLYARGHAAALGRRLVDDEVGRPGGRRGERGLARQVLYWHAAEIIRTYWQLIKNEKCRKGRGIAIAFLLVADNAPY
jgi:hypothetical protein